MGSRRPNPAQWLWYAYGGGLAPHLREWVIFDVTCRTWVLRHLSRTFAQWLPCLLLVLVPGPLWLRLCMPLLVLIGALYASACYIEETCEHRLAKHGYPLGMARELRHARREMARLERSQDLRRGLEDW